MSEKTAVSLQNALCVVAAAEVCRWLLHPEDYPKFPAAYAKSVGSIENLRRKWKRNYSNPVFVRGYIAALQVAVANALSEIEGLSHQMAYLIFVVRFFEAKSDSKHIDPLVLEEESKCEVEEYKKYLVSLLSLLSSFTMVDQVHDVREEFLERVYRPMRSYVERAKRIQLRDWKRAWEELEKKTV